MAKAEAAAGDLALQRAVLVYLEDAKAVELGGRFR